MCSSYDVGNGGGYSFKNGKYIVVMVLVTVQVIVLKMENI